MSKVPVDRVSGLGDFPAEAPTDVASPLNNTMVRDESGELLIVYHGTNQDFTHFDESRIGVNTNAACSVAFFFTEKPVEAAEYADLAARTQIIDAVSHEVKIESLRKQIVASEKKMDWSTAERLYLEMEDLDLGAINDDPSGQVIYPVFLNAKNIEILDLGGSFDGHRVAAAIQRAKSEGKDGLKLTGVYDPVAARPGAFDTTQWVVFRSDQILSAVGASGSALGVDDRQIRIAQAMKGLSFIEAQKSAKHTLTINS